MPFSRLGGPGAEISQVLGEQSLDKLQLPGMPLISAASFSYNPNQPEQTTLEITLNNQNAYPVGEQQIVIYSRLSNDRLKLPKRATSRWSPGVNNLHRSISLEALSNFANNDYLPHAAIQGYEKEGMETSLPKPNNWHARMRDVIMYEDPANPDVATRVAMEITNQGPWNDRITSIKPALNRPDWRVQLPVREPVNIEVPLSREQVDQLFNGDKAILVLTGNYLHLDKPVEVSTKSAALQIETGEWTDRRSDGYVLAFNIKNPGKLRNTVKKHVVQHGPDLANGTTELASEGQTPLIIAPGKTLATSVIVPRTEWPRLFAIDKMRINIESARENGDRSPSNPLEIAPPKPADPLSLVDEPEWIGTGPEPNELRLTLKNPDKIPNRIVRAQLIDPQQSDTVRESDSSIELRGDEIEPVWVMDDQTAQLTLRLDDQKMAHPMFAQPELTLRLWDRTENPRPYPLKLFQPTATRVQNKRDELGQPVIEKGNQAIELIATNPNRVVPVKVAKLELFENAADNKPTLVLDENKYPGIFPFDLKAQEERNLRFHLSETDWKAFRRSLRMHVAAPTTQDKVVDAKDRSAIDAANTVVHIDLLQTQLVRSSPSLLISRTKFTVLNGADDAIEDQITTSLKTHNGDTLLTGISKPYTFKRGKSSHESNLRIPQNNLDGRELDDLLVELTSSVTGKQVEQAIPNGLVDMLRYYIHDITRAVVMLMTTGMLLMLFLQKRWQPEVRMSLGLTLVNALPSLSGFFYALLSFFINELILDVALFAWIILAIIFFGSYRLTLWLLQYRLFQTELTHRFNRQGYLAGGLQLQANILGWRYRIYSLLAATTLTGMMLWMSLPSLTAPPVSESVQVTTAPEAN